MASQFNPDEYLKDFNPDEYLNNSSVPMEEAPGKSTLDELTEAAKAAPVALGQGMSLGLANEAGAGLGALTGAVATKLDPRQDITREEILATLSPEVRAKATEVVRPKPEDFSSLLEEYYKVGKKGQSDLTAAAPGTSLAANLAGGIATMKMPGLSQLSTLKSLSLPGKMIEGAAKGAVAGGVSGLTGEGETVEERLSDAATGVGIGGALGGALPLVPAAIKGTYETGKKAFGKVFKSEFIKQIPEYFEAGMKGKGLTSTEDLDKYANELYDQAEKMGIDVGSLAEETISGIKSSIKDATDKGVKVDIKGLLKDQLGSLDEGFEKLPLDKEELDLKQLQKNLLKLKEKAPSGELTPEQLYKQERGFAKLGTADITKKYETTAERKQIVDEFKKLMKENVSPEVSKNQGYLSKIKSFGEVLGIKDFDPEEVGDIGKIFSTMRSSSKAANVPKQKQLEKAFNYLKEVPKGEEIVSKYKPAMEQAAKDMQMTEQVIGGKAGGGYARSKALMLANIAGEMTPEWAKSAASSISQGSNKASAFVADQLEKIAMEPNKEKRNAILFGLMQNPTYRDMLGQHSPQGSEDESEQ